ncbi:MAG: di-heme oxidoredictase family protein [Acidobacteriota bacterium]
MTTRLILAILAALGLAFSQSGNLRPLPGDALGGITPLEFELFRLGLEDFTEVETAADGLGPAFNGASCAVCHSVPAIGGISAMTEIRAGHRDSEGVFTEIGGGTLFHLFSTPPHTCQVQLPNEANVIARRAPIPLFGAGLVEAIGDETLLALEDPEDANHDGVSGRAARIVDVATQRPRIGRFGWKAQNATLLAFSGDAYRNEMGVTNDLFPQETALGIDAAQLRLCGATRGVEDVRDRRTKLRAIDLFEGFMKFLAPIGRAEMDAEVRAQVSNGEAVFQSIGCAACHTPVLMTAPNANPVFDRKPVPLFSDLLLHDVATGDGIPQAGAAADEIRTTPLWGLRFRRPLLHDGSAATASDAILRHGAEAKAALERYQALPAVEREALLRFLASL